MTETYPEGPLDGLRVLDLTQFMAGPYCTLILADMGADVIKIERPGGGDQIREWHGNPRNPMFMYMNRGKRSLTLDLKSEAGRALFLRLVKDVDVVVENFRPTVMEKLGLSYETLAVINPRLVYCAISGYGSDGPYREKGGFDLIAQAAGGIMHVTGEPDGPPTSVGLPITDLGSGMFGVSGILAACWQRLRTGRGQRVEASLLETAVAFSSWTGAVYLAGGKEPTRQGSRHRQSAPYQRFNTADGYLVIGAGTQALWERLARALERPEWIGDERFTTNEQRVAHRGELEEELEGVLAGASTAHWVGVLDEGGIPCAPVNDYARLFADPQVRHRECVVEREDPEAGTVRLLRTPLRMSEGAVTVRRLAPRLGEHNREILAEFGLEPNEIDTLAEQGVI
ncbi:MAG: CaiB/BaiF CoA-transferase family protein [SAR324 cluster bacterium]|nr:CaiB/BaiF CoA-transferase family protein [SAR324 cluster bacterium]